MSIWTNINKRSEGSVIRQEDIAPELDTLRNACIKMSKDYNTMRLRVDVLLEQLKSYYDLMGINPYYYHYPARYSSLPENYSTEYLNENLKSNDLEQVKQFAHRLRINCHNIRQLLVDLINETREYELIEQHRRHMEEEEEKKREEALKHEREKAVKEQSFLNGFLNTGLFLFGFSILSILVYLFIDYFGGNSPNWLMACFLIFLCVGFIIIDSVEEGFKEMKEHIKKYI